MVNYAGTIKRTAKVPVIGFGRAGKGIFQTAKYVGVVITVGIVAWVVATPVLLLSGGAFDALLESLGF